MKRCYEVDITFFYQIPGGLTNSTIARTKTAFSNYFKTVSSLFLMVPQCSGVNTTREEVTASPPGVNSIFFRVPLILTASSNVADDQVSTRLTDCLNTATSSFKIVMDNNAPSITQGGVRHTKYNLSTISEKRSCCGGDIPPPCCGVGAVNVSSTKCGKKTRKGKRKCFEAAAFF